MSTRTDYYRHNNSTDTLDAIPLTDGVWSATGAIQGDDSQVPGLYVFTGLNNTISYEIRIRSGENPSSSDLAIASFSEVKDTVTLEQLTEAKEEILNRGNEAWVKGATSSGGTVGPGSTPKPFQITSNGVPVDGAAVWITLDAEGQNVIAGTLYSNGNGWTPDFMLDTPGTYYLWVQKNKVQFPNPTEVTLE